MSFIVHGVRWKIGLKNNNWIYSRIEPVAMTGGRINFDYYFQVAAYILVSAIRRIGLSGTELSQGQCGTIRLKLFKIGAVIIRNTRRIRFLLSSGFPYQNLFSQLAAKLCAG